MKRKFAMRALGLCAILLAFGLARAQSSQSAGHTKGTPPAATGLEAVKGDKAKQQWIDSHPAEYAKLAGKTESTPATTPYGAAENKEAWIQAHPEEYAKIVGTQKSAPSGKAAIAEKAVVTPAAPVERTEAEKLAWIKANPAEYAKLANTTVPQAKAVAEEANDPRIRISRAEFDALPAAKRQAMTESGNYLVVDKPATR